MILTQYKYYHRSHHKWFLLFLHCFWEMRPWRDDTWKIMVLHSRSTLKLSQSLKYRLSEIVHLIDSIFILYYFDWKMYLLIESISLIIRIIFGNIIVYIFSKSNSGFICPASRNIFDCITSTSHHYCWNTKFKHIVEASSMTPYTEIELSKFIIAQTICSTLHNQSMRPVFAHYSCHYISEKLIESIIGDSWLQGYIQCIFFTISFAIFIKSARSWEEVLSILMKRYSHASITQIESLFHTISMMNIDIQVKHSRINLKKLQNCENYIIYITKTTRL